MGNSQRRTAEALMGIGVTRHAPRWLIFWMRPDIVVVPESWPESRSGSSRSITSRLCGKRSSWRRSDFVLLFMYRHHYLTITIKYIPQRN